jgi:hypothetical protein
MIIISGIFSSSLSVVIDGEVEFVGSIVINDESNNRSISKIGRITIWSIVNV